MELLFQGNWFSWLINYFPLLAWIFSVITA
jgi:hypothetical protein